MKERPLVRYHGGKWKLAPWIISHFPTHRVYVEPFGGGGSVLLRKPRCYAEIYNDLDGEIVNLFRVARDHGEQLMHALVHTPFARVEFDLSYEPSDDPIEQARRTVVRSFMGFGSSAINGKPSGFRANSTQSGTTPAYDWGNYPTTLQKTLTRLRGIVIENRDAVDCMNHHDCEEALHFVDPPYVMETRCKTSQSGIYKHEMTEEQHIDLAKALKSLKGAVVLSGYRCDLYDELYESWPRIDKAAHADGARDRIESIWLNRTPVSQLFSSYADTGQTGGGV